MKFESTLFCGLRLRSSGLRLLLLVLALGAWSRSELGATPIATGPATALAAFKLKNGTRQEVTDYHLVIDHNSPDPHIKVDFKKVPRFGLPFNAHPITEQMVVSEQFPTGEVIFTLNLDVKVAENKTLEVYLPLERTLNQFRIGASYWTGVDVLGNQGKIADIPVPGFKVVGDPEYTIFNDFDDPMGIRGLQFLFNVPEINSADLDPGYMAGFGATLSDFVLPAHSSFTIFVPGVLDPGNFLYAQGFVYDELFTTESASFLHGHQEPVPEGGTTLALLGLAGGTFGLVRMGASFSRRHLFKPMNPRSAIPRLFGSRA